MPGPRFVKKNQKGKNEKIPRSVPLVAVEEFFYLLSESAVVLVIDIVERSGFSRLFHCAFFSYICSPFSEGMRGRIKKTLRLCFSLLVAAVLLYFSFREVKWDEFAKSLENCHWGYVLGAMLAGVVAPLFRGLRWRRTILPFDKSIDRLTTFNGVAIGNLANLAIPYSGEIARCSVVRRHSRTGNSRFSTLLGTAALERVCDLLTIMLLFVVLLALKWSSFGGFFKEKIAFPLAARFGSGFIWMVGGLLLLLGLLFFWWMYRHRGDNSLPGRLFGVLKTLYEGFISFTKMDGASQWRFAFDTFAIWAMYWVQIVFISKALPGVLDINVADALFISLVGSVAALIPAPGGFGAYHYLVAGVLYSLYGLEWGSGLVFATIAHESQVVTFIVTGLVALGIELIRKKNVQTR